MGVLCLLLVTTYETVTDMRERERFAASNDLALTAIQNVHECVRCCLIPSKSKNQPSVFSLGMRRNDQLSYRMQL